MANKSKNSKESSPIFKVKDSTKPSTVKKTAKNKSLSNGKKNQSKTRAISVSPKPKTVKVKKGDAKKRLKINALLSQGNGNGNGSLISKIAEPRRTENPSFQKPNSTSAVPLSSGVVRKDIFRERRGNKPKNALTTSPQSTTKLNRSVINVIRTTQRNNINLKHIADNKANILMSINALMITILFPVVLSNLELIMEMRYYVPLGVLAITCLVTVVLSALVLRPFSNRGKVMRKMTEFREKSPFFFENYDRMEVEEYYDYFCNVSQDEEMFFKYVIEDLHYYGKILSLKYTQVKHAYTGFIIGIVLTAFSMLVVSLIYGG